MLSHSISYSNIECHYCHNKGNIATQCPYHTLAMEIKYGETLLDGSIEDFNLLESATLKEEYKEDCEDLEGCINIMRCIITTLTDSKAWKHTSIFLYLCLM